MTENLEQLLRDNVSQARAGWAATLDELNKARQRIAALEAEPRTPYGIELDEAHAERDEWKRRVAALEAELVKRDVDTFARVHDLEDTDARATKIIAGYRKLHVDQHQEIHKLDLALEIAWTIIANAHGGDWTVASLEWQDAAASWRDLHFHASLNRRREAREKTLTPSCSPSTSPQA